MNHLTWVELNREAYRFNMEHFRKLAGNNRKIMAIIKSNAYGHGLYETALLAQECGNADMLGVYSLQEAKHLYGKGIKLPIFIMGYVMAEEFNDIARHDFSICISSLDQLKAVAETIGTKTLKIHLKFDTGLRRLGFLPEETQELLAWLSEHENFRVEGIFSHFANIEDTVSHDFAKEQRDTFEKMCAPFMKKYNPLRHIACSAAGLLFPDTYFEMIRSGISMYGMWPSKETLITSLKSNMAGELKPVLSWKTRIAQVKDVKPGDTVGYGRSHAITRPGRIAIIPVGYNDGYCRKYSNSAKVIVRGIEAPVIGRICMNMSMIDVSHIKDASREDEVILIGSCGNSSVTADFLAGISDTINYEVTTRISPFIPRVIV
ncbi:MAG: alanine racemase [bacterium]|nr:alanine racemase [bacterium]